MLQIHDEILVEAAVAEVDATAELVTTTMRDAYEMRVPLDVNLAVGDSWAEAKS